RVYIGLAGTIKCPVQCQGTTAMDDLDSVFVSFRSARAELVRHYAELFRLTHNVASTGQKLVGLAERLDTLADYAGITPEEVQDALAVRMLREAKEAKGSQGS